MEVSVTAVALGLETEIVYPSDPPPATLALSAVLVVTSGRLPSGEKVIRLDTAPDPPAGTPMDQLRPAPLSILSVHRHVLAKGVWVPMALHTSENLACR